jgi:hypothetical protein
VSEGHATHVFSKQMHNTDFYYCEDFFKGFLGCNTLHTECAVKSCYVPRSVLLNAAMYGHAVLQLHVDSYHLDDAPSFSWYLANVL